MVGSQLQLDPHTPLAQCNPSDTGMLSVHYQIQGSPSNTHTCSIMAILSAMTVIRRQRKITTKEIKGAVPRVHRFFPQNISITTLFWLLV